MSATYLLRSIGRHQVASPVQQANTNDISRLCHEDSGLHQFPVTRVLRARCRRRCLNSRRSHLTRLYAAKERPPGSYSTPAEASKSNWVQQEEAAEESEPAVQKHNLVDQDDGAGDGTSPPQQRSLTSTTNAGLERVTKLVDAAEGGWQALPAKTQIVVATGAAYVFSNLDKVILSIAIIPMAQEMGWSPSVSGLVQSSFFWGYILVQLPGGYLISKSSGRRMLPIGVALWSLGTAALPVSASAIPALCLSRALVGLGEGLAPPSSTDLIARTIPNSERTAAVAQTFSGLHIGSIIALLAGPAIIEALGWRSVFYIFGISGLLWCAWWERLLHDTYDNGRVQAEKEEAEREQGVETLAPAEQNGGGYLADKLGVEDKLPLRAFLREPAVKSLMYVHFCNNWFHYTMLAWLPTFYIQTLDLDLLAASELSILPPVAAFAGSNIAGPAADALIASGTPVEKVRKTMQGVAFLLPTALLIGAANFEDHHIARIACITLALGFNSFSMAGLYSNHADLSPKYCSILLSMTNTTGAIPGIIGVTCTGVVLQRTGNWNLALFAPCIFFFLTGFVNFMIYGSSERKAFDKTEPFAFERFLPWGSNRSTDSPL